jgi:hypothetical protein
MKKYLLVSVVCMLFWFTCRTTAQSTADDPVSRICYFSGNQVNHIPHGISIIEDDSLCRKIADKCASGAELSELENSGIDSLHQRLDLLLQKKLIKIDSGKFYLTIPVIMGEKKNLLIQVVTTASARLMPAVESMIPRLQEALGERRDVAFHLLWSRIIDKVWWKAFENEFSIKDGPPNTAWIVYPTHPYMVGTNYNSDSKGEIGITWSYGYQGSLWPIMKSFLALLDASSGGTVADSVKGDLQGFGCVDSAGHSLVLYFREGDKIDQLCDKLKDQYDNAFHNVYDFQLLSKQFNIQPDDLFIILMHETAYALFENLDRSGKLTFPPVLLGKAGRETTLPLVSIELWN